MAPVRVVYMCGLVACVHAQPQPPAALRVNHVARSWADTEPPTSWITRGTRATATSNRTIAVMPEQSVAHPEDEVLLSWEYVHTNGSAPTRGATVSAYRVQVCAWQAAAGCVPVYDSGRVNSSAHMHTVPNSVLQANTRHTWSVMWWDGLGAASGWSSDEFIAALPRPSSSPSSGVDWSASRWVACPAYPYDDGLGLAQLRTEIDASQLGQIFSAHLYVACAGVCTVAVDGAATSAAEFGADPGTFTRRVLYDVFDVTGQVAAGRRHVPPRSNVQVSSTRFARTHVHSSAASHAIAVLLGWGWTELRNQYYMGENTTIDGNGPWQRSSFQRRLRAQLIVTLGNGTKLSLARTGQDAWMCGRGAWVNASVYDGAQYYGPNATTGWDMPGYNYSSGLWLAAIDAADPGGDLVAESAEPIELIRTLDVQRLWSITPGVYGIDFGQAFGGYVRITLAPPVPANVTIVVRQSEALLHPPNGPANGSLDFSYLRAAKATDVYTTWAVDGDAVIELAPVFTWHGIRYAEIDWSQMPASYNISNAVFTGMHFRTGMAAANELYFPETTDADILNDLAQAIWWTQGSNSVGHPSDCVSRSERLGWTGDAALASLSMPYFLQAGAYYAHWANMIADSIVASEDPGFAGPGALPYVVPHIGPFGAHFSPDTAWSSVWPTTLALLWLQYNDTRQARESWPQAMAFVTRLAAMVNESGIGALPAAYGDWAPANASSAWESNWTDRAPGNLTAASAFMIDVALLIQLAEALGFAQDAAYLASLLPQLQAQFAAAFGVGSVFGGGSGIQTCQALALAAGAVPASNISSAALALVDNIRNEYGGHFSTGVLGFARLHRALTDTGFGHVALDTLLVHGFPGPWYSFREAEWEHATAMWELWHSDVAEWVMDSRNQQMWTSVGAWLVEDLLGLRATAPGWTSFTVHPRVMDHPALPSMSGSVHTQVGNISISWSYSSSVHAAVSVPVGAVATVRLPAPAGVAPSSITAAEAGRVFFTHLAFIPGVPGVAAATWNDADATLDIELGSGVFDLLVGA